MLALIKRILKDITSIPSTVERWALGLINALHNYVNSLFAELRRAVNDVHDALVNFGRSIERFAHRVYTLAHWIINTLVPSVIHWAMRELRKIATDLDNVLHWAERWITRILNDIVSAIRNITKWVIKHIWNPLYHAIAVAWHWITHEGYFVWHLLTHPNLVAKMLAKYIWASWLDLFKRYSRQIARWLLASMPHMVDDIVTALEDFIAGLL